MLLPIKAICKTNRVRRDGASVIYIQYCQDSDKRTLLNTGLAVPPKHWHPKRQYILNDLPAVFGKADELNDRLRFLVRRTEDLITFFLKKEIVNIMPLLNEFFNSELTLAQIEILLRERQSKVDLQNPKLNLDFYFQIDDYIKSKSQKVAPGMLRIYRNMKEHLQAFDEYRGTATTFQSFDLDYYESLLDFLSLHYVQRPDCTQFPFDQQHFI